ncbi:MAG TPA: preprotein translocase subunit YajC [Bacillota bacterium]|nr:preprotein translocase subunit YajC [Bacillota bacterium]
MNSQVITWLYIAGLFLVLYFLMIRPQQQRQKKHQEMLKSLKTDDRVITVGGIYGTIVKIKDKSVVLRVADNVRIEFSKTAISGIISKDEEEKGSD